MKYLSIILLVILMACNTITDPMHDPSEKTQKLSNTIESPIISEYEIEYLFACDAKLDTDRDNKDAIFNIAYRGGDGEIINTARTNQYVPMQMQRYEFRIKIKTTDISGIFYTRNYHNLRSMNLDESNFWTVIYSNGVVVRSNYRYWTHSHQTSWTNN